jgi:MarR family transcriptional regulator, organic hydroperoxide resistance regulator
MIPSSPPLIQVFQRWMDVFTSRSMRDWMRFVKSTGLSMPQFSILMMLHYRQTGSISEISERQAISAGAASQLVERLVQAGFIERKEDSEDRRAKVLSLTDKGRELIEAGSVERTRWLDDLIAYLSPDECEKVSKALEVLVNIAGQLEKGAKHP